MNISTLATGVTLFRLKILLNFQRFCNTEFTALFKRTTHFLQWRFDTTTSANLSIEIIGKKKIYQQMVHLVKLHTKI